MDQIKNLLLTFCTKYFTFIFSKTGCIVREIILTFDSYSIIHISAQLRLYFQTILIMIDLVTVYHKGMILKTQKEFPYK